MMQMSNKQFLDEVFVISGIIKVEVGVISRTEGRLITLTETLIIMDITKTKSIIVLLHLVFKKIATKRLLHRTQFILDKPSYYFAVRRFDLALRNHALRAQPTD